MKALTEFRPLHVCLSQTCDKNTFSAYDWHGEPNTTPSFAAQNSGGLQDPYTVSRPICAVRNGTGKEIADYLDIKFSRLGKVRTKIITDEGCEAWAAKLRKQTRNHVVYSVGYPLLVNNWTRRAMNEAAELGADAVDADVVNAL